MWAEIITFLRWYAGIGLGVVFVLNAVGVAAHSTSRNDLVNFLIWPVVLTGMAGVLFYKYVLNRD